MTGMQWRYSAEQRCLGGLVLLVGIAAMLSAAAWLPGAARAQAPDGAQTWDFEAGDLGDWKTAGQVQLIDAAIDPLTDGSMQQVAQGQHSAMIGDATAWGVSGDQTSSIERTVTVPQANGKPVLQFSYAVVANDPPLHPETEKPYFQLQVHDLTSGELLPVSDFKYTSQTSQAWFLGQPPADQSVLQFGFSQLSGDRWVFVPWRHENVDLADRIGHQLLLQFVVRDCIPAAHPAYGYIDNIHLGAEVAPPALPALLKQPLPAGAPPAPNPIQRTSTKIEQWSLWPWCLALPLLLLVPLAIYFRPRAVQPVSGLEPGGAPEPRVARQPHSAGNGSTWQGGPSSAPSRGNSNQRDG